jgi:hypothetical protein
MIIVRGRVSNMYLSDSAAHSYAGAWGVLFF